LIVFVARRMYAFQASLAGQRSQRRLLRRLPHHLLPRQPDSEVADVDHLLHFAQAFLQDLAVFQGDPPAEVVLRRAQLHAEAAHQFAAQWWRDVAPGGRGSSGLREAGSDAVDAGRRHAADR
jgi:hypothetical protein